MSNPFNRLRLHWVKRIGTAMTVLMLFLLTGYLMG
jgi:hypothetical protein